jgi:stage II sporulation protein D
VRSFCLAKWMNLKFFRDRVKVWGTRGVGKRFLPIAFLILMPTANGQSLRQALETRLASLSEQSHSALLLWDLARGESLAAVRPAVFAAPHSLGSLVKPFLLLAYLNERCGDLTSHPREAAPCPAGDESSVSETPPAPVAGSLLRPCVGRATAQCPVECWYQPGHGKLEMSQALAVSCNQYFYQLSKLTSPAAFFKVLAALGVSLGSEVAGAVFTRPETMLGLDSSLRLVPLQLLNAYGALISGQTSAATQRFATTAFAHAILLRGLRLSAAEGTSALAQRALPLHHALLGKTGTSPALLAGRYSESKTDGWFLGFYPAVQPVLAVMVYYPNGLGAKDAAPLGGQAIRMYLEMVSQ